MNVKIGDTDAILTEDDLLEEFGFRTNKKTGSKGRGHVIDMIGSTSGLFVCIRRNEQNKKNGESLWVMKCSRCGGERVVQGSTVRSMRVRCYECEGRPPNPHPKGSALKNWPAYLEDLKLKMTDAMANGNLEDMQTIARKISRVASRVTALAKSEEQA